MALQGVLITPCHLAQSLLLTQGLGHERYLLHWNRKTYTQQDVDKDCKSSRIYLYLSLAVTAKTKINYMCTTDLTMSSNKVNLKCKLLQEICQDSPYYSSHF
jgi:hypothetical protein